jgi:hypothetical protein
MNVEFKKFSTKRSFGVELEVNATVTLNQIRDLIKGCSSKEICTTPHWANTVNNNYWHVKFDRTCGILGKSQDHGWEVASYIASGYKDLLHIAQVADALQVGGVQVNENCGLHIHVGVPDFSTTEMGVLIAHWLRIEPMMCRILPQHRVKNKYCKLLTKIKRYNFSRTKEYLPDDLWKLFQPEDLGYHENQQKKVSLNLVNYARCSKEYMNDGRKTVELRMPEGTLSGYDIRNWIRLFLLFVENSKTIPMPKTLEPVTTIEEFMQYFSLNGSSSFFLLSKGLRETKVWLLNRMLIHGGQKYSADTRKILRTLT